VALKQPKRIETMKMLIAALMAASAMAATAPAASAQPWHHHWHHGWHHGWHRHCWWRHHHRICR
jgi:Spy/CpxP family protein refolding chaperone